MVHCKFCNKEFETASQCKAHVAHCTNKEWFYEKVNNFLTEEKLYDFIVNQHLSGNYIATKIIKDELGLQLSAGYILDLAKKYGIKTLSVAEANANPKRQELSRKYFQEKYGVDNCSQILEVQKKKEDSFYKHYGIKNIFCDGEYIRNKFKEKYGIEYVAWVPEFVNKIKKGNCGRYSKLQQLFENILDKNFNIKYKSDEVLNFAKYNEELKKEYNPRPDIVIEDKKIIIEIQGDRWHCNPKFYKKGDIIDYKYGHNKLTAEDIWKYDDIRKRHLESFGYKVYFIWEDEIRNHKNELLCKLKDILK